MSNRRDDGFLPQLPPPNDSVYQTKPPNALFYTLALPVAAHFGFSYRQEEENGMQEYLRMVSYDILELTANYIRV